MPAISDERRLERRMQILDAAWACFQRQGLHVTRMNDIIRASGLSAGAVYSYFKSKDDLIQAALTTSLAGAQEVLAPILAREPPLLPDALVRAVAEAIDGFTVREQFDLKRLALLGWSEAQRNPALREAMQGYYAGFRQGLARIADRWRRDGLLAPGDAEDAAKAVMGVLLGYIVQAAVLGDVTPAQMAAGVRMLAPTR